MIDTVYILGNHIQALGLARLAKKAGLKVCIFNDSWASVARFSNACHRFYLFKNKLDLLTMLKSFATRKDTLLLATNDSLVDFLCYHYSELSQLYYLSIPNPETVAICYNKRLTYQKAKDLDIPIPQSYFPDSIDDINQIADSITFPVILKPAIMHTFHSVTGKKVFFCEDKQKLMLNYQKMIKIIPANEVILQEFLRGGSKVLYSFGSFSAYGRIFGSFSANRIRQNPMDFGNSTCYAITVSEPIFEEFASRFLIAIDYFGLSEVEFMKDLETGQYKMLEINPRAWKWHSIANRLNINLLKMMVDYLNGNNVIEKHNDLLGIAWIERFTDIYISLKEILHGRMKFSEYWKSLLVPKESAVFMLSDPLPTAMYFILFPYLFFKR